LETTGLYASPVSFKLPRYRFGLVCFFYATFSIDIGFQFDFPALGTITLPVLILDENDTPVNGTAANGYRAHFCRVLLNGKILVYSILQPKPGPTWPSMGSFISTRSTFSWITERK